MISPIIYNINHKFHLHRHSILKTATNCKAIFANNKHECGSRIIINGLNLNKELIVNNFRHHRNNASSLVFPH